MMKVRFNNENFGVVAYTTRGDKMERDDFDTVVYLRGRREYLKAQSKIHESGCTRARCSDARLSEVCELLTILESLEGGKGGKRET